MKINEQRLRFVLNARTGAVGLHLGKIGARAESAAKVIATQERLVRSGRYRASLAWRPGNDGRGQFVEVGSTAPNAKLIEHGTPPHEIRPRNKRALYWEHGADRGWFVPGHPLPRVHHPGTRPYAVIRRAIRFAARGGMV